MLDIISRTVIVHGLFNNNNNDHDNNDNHNTDTDNDNGNGMEWKHVVERTGGYIMSDFIRLLRRSKKLFVSYFIAKRACIA